MNISSRTQWVDISKGIAIISVVLLHINFEFYNSKCIPLSPLLGSLWHVPVFFLLGGFFIKEEKLLQPISFIKGKIKSLYSLLLYFYIPAVLLHNVMLHIGFYNPSISYSGKTMTLWNISKTIKEVILAIFLAGREPILGAMWFVYVLFMAICGFSIISTLIHRLVKDSNKYEWTRCIILLFLCILSSTMTNVFTFTIPRFNNTLTAMWLIYCGYILMNKFQWNFTNKIACLISILIVYYIAIIEGGVALNGNQYHDALTLTASSIAALYIVNYISRKIEKTYIGYALSYCGRNSFYIMGLHFLGFKLGTIILSYIGIKQNLGELTAPAQSSITLLLFYLIFFYTILPNFYKVFTSSKNVNTISI